MAGQQIEGFIALNNWETIWESHSRTYHIVCYNSILYDNNWFYLRKVKYQLKSRACRTGGPGVSSQVAVWPKVIWKESCAVAIDFECKF